jgi:ABC-type multidrug transport system ATPase subunit
MNGYAIETCGLNYNFGNQKVVDNLSLQVPKGSIYGFLGPNGAGKTTTIKILLNLLKSHSDTVFIFGKDINTNRIASLKKIGALVEQPAIYTHLSGRENLINRCILLRIPRSKVMEMLVLVGLKDAADKKAGKYSLGMKQRLGIALALLSDPELLLLDEPTNGLDPNGIIEIRNLMAELTSKYQKTILVSSHLLNEIEKIATHVGIINKGKLLFQGSINELQTFNSPIIEIEAENPAEAAAFLSARSYENITAAGNILQLPYQSAVETGKVNTLLVQNGFTVYSIHLVKKDLEGLFLDITKTN